MNLEILQCTELQRDFLIRYANAAKSKSTVVVKKEDAETLVSFYVDPRPRAPRNTSTEDLHSLQATDKGEYPRHRFVHVFVFYLWVMGVSEVFCLGKQHETGSETVVASMLWWNN